MTLGGQHIRESACCVVQVWAESCCLSIEDRVNVPRPRPVVRAESAKSPRNSSKTGQLQVPDDSSLKLCSSPRMVDVV
jgi:hypothetical protein